MTMQRASHIVATKPRGEAPRVCQLPVRPVLASGVTWPHFCLIPRQKPMHVPGGRAPKPEWVSFKTASPHPMILYVQSREVQAFRR